MSGARNKGSPPQQVDDALIALLRADTWQSTRELFEVVRMRVRVTYEAFWARLRTLERSSRVERRGSVRGKFEWRLLSVVS